MTRYQALNILTRYAIPQDDFHTLSSAQVDSVLAAADEYGYRKPRGANGSRGRYFHAFLLRVAKRESD